MILTVKLFKLTNPNNMNKLNHNLNCLKPLKNQSLGEWIFSVFLKGFTNENRFSDYLKMQ